MRLGRNYVIYNAKGQPSRRSYSWWALGQRVIRSGRRRQLILRSRAWGRFTRRYTADVPGSAMTLAEQRTLYDEAPKLGDRVRS